MSVPNASSRMIEVVLRDSVEYITAAPDRGLRTDELVFGDIAHLLVLYEAHIPGSDRPPRQGVDSFQLVRREGRWWIVGVTNELPTPDRPLPPVLHD